MTVHELARLLKTTPKVIRGYMIRNNVPRVKVGKNHRILVNPNNFYPLYIRKTFSNDETGNW